MLYFRLFEDVAPVLQQIAEEDFMLFIYSSGSVEAQKLLLAHTADGDITDVSIMLSWLQNCKLKFDIIN